MLVEYVQEEREFRLSGFSGRESTATASLVTFDRAQRLKRAWLGLATWWAVALATVFIPVAHFFLVPGFFLFGIYSFVQRSRTSVVALSMRGGCPDCSEEQEFDVPSPWAEPAALSCTHCGRSLKLTPR